MSDEHGQTYTHRHFLEDDRARIIGRVRRAQDDAWFRPSPFLQHRPEFEIRFFAIGAPITIRFSAVRREPENLFAMRMVASVEGRGVEQPPGSVVMRMAAPPSGEG